MGGVQQRLRRCTTKTCEAQRSSDRIAILGCLSKAYESAIVNLSASLPLPSTWYQTHHWRIHYDDQLQKHRQFKDEYIYAFTWEDAKVDTRLLKIHEDDVILAITSAGDNILQYALERPKRIHAVDLKSVHEVRLGGLQLTFLPAQRKTTSSNSNSPHSPPYLNTTSGSSLAKAATPTFAISCLPNSHPTSPVSPSSTGYKSVPPPSPATASTSRAAAGTPSNLPAGSSLSSVY